MMNPMQIMQMMKGGGNPQQMIMNMMRQQAGSNPVTPTVKSLIIQGLFLLCCISCCIGFQNVHLPFDS